MSSTSFLDQFNATKWLTVSGNSFFKIRFSQPVKKYGNVVKILDVAQNCLTILAMHPKGQMPATICGILGSLTTSLDLSDTYSRLGTKEIVQKSLISAEGIAGLFSKEASNVLTLALRSIGCYTIYNNPNISRIYFINDSINLVVFAILSFSKHNQLVRCALIVRSAVNARYIYNNRPEKLSVSNLVSASVMVICLRQAYLMGSA